MSPATPFDGQIFAVTARSTADGRPFNEIHFYGKQCSDNTLVQFESRAVYYVERYGWDQAKANAHDYDPTFNIFENLENSRRPPDAPDSMLLAAQAQFERLQADPTLSDRDRLLGCRIVLRQVDQSSCHHAARVLRTTVLDYLSAHHKAHDDN